MSGLGIDVGACIYCGDLRGPLTREHVLPRGLGGNWAPEGHSDAFVLQHATCPSCSRITQKIEEECLRSMMDSGRARLGLKRMDRIAPMPAMITGPDGTTDCRDIDPDEILGVVLLPSYYEAGALTNKSIADGAPCDYRSVVVAPAGRRLLEQSALVGVRLSCNSRTFAQMLAKIALGVAVARLGLRGFEPLVRDFILSKPHEYGHWVGGFAGAQTGEARAPALHRIQFLSAQRASAGIFVIVELQLFAEFGGPTNYVVVGRPN